MIRNTFQILILAGLLLARFTSYSQQFPTGFAPQQLIENLDPTDFVITNDNQMFITIKSGKILVVENEQLAPQVFLNIEQQVDNFNERGLGHMVLDPNFEINHYYYVYYTVKNENRNRISRFTANGNSTLPESEFILLNLNSMAGSIHNGGAMGFGADGKLYVSVGDGADAGTAQLKTTLLGKVLRMNPDGSVPTDNPFFSDVTYAGSNKLIYALGFRNPFSMDIQPGTGKIMVCDVGNSAWEEVNEIQAGKNYGWPGIEGVRTTQTPPPDYKDPLYAYSHDNACSIVGAAFYNPEHDQFPTEYVGKFFFADYCAGYIQYVDPVNGMVQPFGTDIDRPLAIRVNHEGTLYYLQRAGMGGGSTGDNTSTPDGSLWKVTYTGTGEPGVGAQPQNILVSVGEDATFSVSVSGNIPLTLQWQVNGTDISGANGLNYTLTNSQLSDTGKIFRCQVSNSEGATVSDEATLSVTTNTRPIPVITSPVEGVLYRAGEMISFAGSASDAEDGSLPAAQLTWRIDFHHNEHSHPALQSAPGISSGTYNASRIGETDDNVWYRIYLTATDNQGLHKTIHQDIFPEKTTIQLTTIPIGLTLNIDGQPVLTPAAITSVVGVTRTLEAPSIQHQGNALYVYDQWTESTLNRIFSFNVVNGVETYTGKFVPVPIGEGDGLRGSYFNQSRTFNGEPDLVRTDETINFEWDGGSPHGTIQNDNFTARWEGYILPQFTDTYTFYTVSDDGARLWINNQLIINQWMPQGPTEWAGSYTVTAGEQYPIKVEFFEDEGGAVMKLLWKSTLLPKQIIPKQQLFTYQITGIEDVESAMTLYPTIADVRITVKRNNTRASKWSILNILGQPVLQGIFSHDPITYISVATLPAGAYLFKSLDGERKVIRFVKK